MRKSGRLHGERASALVRSAAAASAVVGVIHIGAMQTHAGRWSGEFTFFGAVGAFQILWAVLVMRRPSVALWRSGALINAAVAVIWALSRTSGLPLGPHSGHPEAVGTPDLLATIFEIVVIGATLALARSAREGAGPKFRCRFALMLVASAVALTPLPGAAGDLSGEPSHQHRQGEGRSASDGSVGLPLASNMVFAYAKGRLVALTYVQQYFCTVDPTDDLDGPGHEGDGKIAATDPDELVTPPCIIGRTRRGSLPAVDPAGKDAHKAPRIYGIIPAFDADGDQVTEDNDPTPAVQSACPQPGPPYTAVKGQVFTCAMHPGFAHAEPYLRTMVGQKTGVPFPGDVVEGDIVVGNHSHIVDVTSSPVRWWLIVVAFVHDRSIWPNFRGQCPAGRGCLTSVAALRAAQRSGGAEPDVPTNAWFDFSVRPVRL